MNTEEKNQDDKIIGYKSGFCSEVEIQDDDGNTLSTEVWLGVRETKGNGFYFDCLGQCGDDLTESIIDVFEEAVRAKYPKETKNYDLNIDIIEPIGVTQPIFTKDEKEVFWIPENILIEYYTEYFNEICEVDQKYKKIVRSILDEITKKK